MSPRPRRRDPLRTTSPISRIQPHHLLRRRILSRLGERRDQAGVLNGEEAFGYLDEHDPRQRHGGEEHGQRDRAVAQDDVQRALIEGQHGVEAGLDDPIEASVPVAIRGA